MSGGTCKRGITTDDHNYWCGRLDVWKSLKLDQDEAANRNIAG